MLRQLSRKTAKCGCPCTDMESDTEERDKRSPAPPPTHVDASVIPKVVEGSGDTPAPITRKKLGVHGAFSTVVRCGSMSHRYSTSK